MKNRLIIIFTILFFILVLTQQSEPWHPETFNQNARQICQGNSAAYCDAIRWQLTDPLSGYTNH